MTDAPCLQMLTEEEGASLVSECRNVKAQRQMIDEVKVIMKPTSMDSKRTLMPLQVT